MAVNLGSAVAYLTLDTSKFTSGFSTAQQAMRTFQSSTATTQDKFTAMGKGLSAVGSTLTKTVTAPLLGFGTIAVKTAADFEQGMSKVQAISGATGSDLEALADKAKEMGAKTKFSATESAEAMEYMAMAGWKTEDMLAGIEGIMNLAAASGEDLALTSDIVTDALTGFGLTAKDTGMFADVLAAASANANTNVAMLGESFKYVAPVAGALGYSVQDTSLALGLMANAGIKASQGGTALRTVLTNMVNPTDNMAAAMDLLGVSLTDNAGNMKSLKEVMVDLREGFKGTAAEQDEFAQATRELSQALSEGRITQEEYDEGINTLLSDTDLLSQSQMAQTAAMLAGKEGMSGLLAIINASDEDFNKLADAIDNSAGSAEEMAAIMLNNLPGAITLLKSQTESLLISIGELLLPMIKDIVQGITNVISWLDSLDESQKKTIVTIAEVIAVIGPLLLIIGKVITIGTSIAGVVTKIIALVGGSGGLGAALAALTGPIGIVIAAVAALAAAWATDFGGIRDKTKHILEDISSIIQSVIGWIVNFWNEHFSWLETALTTFWDYVGPIFSTGLDIIVNIFDVFAALFSGDWEGLWTSVQQLFDTIWLYIQQSFEGIIQVIVDALVQWGVDLYNKIIEMGTSLYESATEAFNKIKQGFEEVWAAIKEWFELAKEDPVAAIKSLFEPLYNAAKDAYQKIKDGFTEVWNSITDWFDLAKDDPVTAVEDIGGALYDAASGAFNQILAGFQAAWGAIASWVESKIGWLKSKIASINSAIGQVGARTAAIGVGAASRVGGSYASGLDYVPRNMAVIVHEGEAILTAQENRDRTRSGGGDIYNFYFSEALTPTKAAQAFKQVKKELALGYY